MSNAVFHELINAPNRLRICAILTPLEEAEFGVVRDELGVSDSVLSKHVSQLAEAGWVAQRKGAVGGRRRTWVSLTGDGRRAFAEHVAALQELASVASNGQGRD